MKQPPGMRSTGPVTFGAGGCFLVARPIRRLSLRAGGLGTGLVVILLAISAAARATDRPSEDDLFGGSSGAAGSSGASLPEGAPPAAAASTPAPPPIEAAPPTSLKPEANAGVGPGVGVSAGRDADVLGDPQAGPRLSQQTAPDDPLRIGGQLYLRAAYTRPGSPIFDFTDPVVTTSRPVTFSAPSLVDAYFDARPNERVRGFVLGRMFFDPTLPSTTVGSNSITDTGMDNAVSPTVPLISGVSNTRGPSVALDQLWLRFDLFQTVFVTAGRQHVKWGTARFWTPTDFLHPVRRNPVAVFDARPGFTMLKLHLPWEERGWNLYAFALVEGVRRWDRAQGAYVAGRDSTENLGQIGGAARAELVYGSAELGLDIVAYKNQKPRFGADLSFGIGDFDLYADAGFQYGSEIPRVDVDCVVGAVPADCVYYASGIKPQITTGGTYSLKYNDNDVFTLAGEYFFNSRGYDSPRVYPNLFATGTFEFFYTGRHYAALSAILSAPGSWNYTNFTFTTLGNLSDQSFISRLDYSHTLLTHLSFEAYGALNYGRRAGELRLGVDDLMVGKRIITLEPQSFSLGVGLRVKI